MWVQNLQLRVLGNISLLVSFCLHVRRLHHLVQQSYLFVALNVIVAGSKEIYRHHLRQAQPPPEGEAKERAGICAADCSQYHVWAQATQYRE
jgi:hypothetical protein